MIYPYVVTLKNQQTKYLDVLGFLLSVISVMFFVRASMNGDAVKGGYVLGSLFIAGVLIYNIYQSRVRGKKVYYNRALLIAALVWMKTPKFEWLCLVFIVLALLEHQAKYSVEIGFSENGILINTLLKKRYKWNDFNNIVLKDGIITLDFVNNKVLQREVEDDDDDDADEDEFNEYCRQQLRSAKYA